jgi:hypothetical protein
MSGVSKPSIFKKMIKIIELGWYHPSSANWAYHIHLIVDETGARLYKETFGGDSRVIEALDKMGLKADRLGAGIGSGVEYKWRDISKLHDIEDYKGKNWGEGGLK